MAEREHVNAQLVRPASDRLEVHEGALQGGTRDDLDGLPHGSRGPARLKVDLHLPEGDQLAVPTKRRRDEHEAATGYGRGG